MRKMLYATTLMAILSTLLINPSAASSILVFAPLNYAPPNFAWWGQWAIGGASLATLDSNTGYTILDANPGPAAFGIALSWFGTGSYTFIGPTQSGSVHFDNWLMYGITGLAGFRVYLWTFRWKIGTIPEVWMSVWSDAIPGWRTKCADVGIHPFDKSWPSGIQFEWTNGYNYMTRVLILAYAAKGSRAVTETAKYDQVAWNAYTSSPSDWQRAPPPEITGYINPPVALNDGIISMKGIGFAPESIIYIYCDDKLVAKTLSDGSGNFATSFTVPPNSTKGHHILKAIDTLENMAEDFFDVFLAAPPLIGDINGDGKIDIKDIALIAKQFGKTDPNVDPPEPATAKDISTSMPTLALIAAISIGLFRLRKKDEGKYKTT